MADPAVLKSRGGHKSLAPRRVKEVNDVLGASSAPDSIKLDQLKRGLMDTFDT